MSKSKGILLQYEQDTPSVGTPMLTGNESTVKIIVSGSATTFTILFEVSIDDVVYVPISGDKISDRLISETSTSTLNEGWEFDIAALPYIRTNLTTVSGGNVTVTASSCS